MWLCGAHQVLVLSRAHPIMLVMCGGFLVGSWDDLVDGRISFRFPLRGYWLRRTWNVIHWYCLAFFSTDILSHTHHDKTPTYTQPLLRCIDDMHHISSDFSLKSSIILFLSWRDSYNTMFSCVSGLMQFPFPINCFFIFRGKNECSCFGSLYLKAAVNDNVSHLSMSWCTAICLQIVIIK